MYPAFYREISAIDKQRDAMLAVAPVREYGFARKENVLPAFFDELARLVHDFPVVFTTHETPVMVTVLGHTINGQIDENGGWKEETYIPAVLRTYPFAGLQDDQGNLAFCIDRQYEGLGEGAGERVFSDTEGNLSPFGLHAARFAASYVNAFKRTREFAAKLKELDLLMPATATVKKNGQTFNFSGFQQVDATKLPAVPPEELTAMIGSQDMYALYLHLYSLNNFTRIV